MEDGDRSSELSRSFRRNQSLELPPRIKVLLESQNSKNVYKMEPSPLATTPDPTRETTNYHPSVSPAFPMRNSDVQMRQSAISIPLQQAKFRSSSSVTSGAKIDRILPLTTRDSIARYGVERSGPNTIEKLERDHRYVAPRYTIGDMTRSFRPSLEQRRIHRESVYHEGSIRSKEEIEQPPRSFRGALANSYVSWPLLFKTIQLVFVLSFMGVNQFFWIPNRISAIDDEKSRDMVKDIVYHGECVKPFTTSLVTGCTVLKTVVLGFATLGWRPFFLYRRNRMNSVYQRTWYITICDSVVIISALTGVGVVVVILWNAVAGFYWDCTTALLDTSITILLAVWANIVVSYVAYFLMWSQVLAYHRFRDHFRLQLGVTLSRDQYVVTCGIAKLLCFSRRSKNERLFRTLLYHAASSGHVNELQKTLIEASSALGDGFHQHMYRTPKLSLGFFATSTYNPLHAAAARGDVDVLEVLVQAGFDINSLDKMNRIQIRVAEGYEALVSRIGWLRRRGQDSHRQRETIYGHYSLFEQTLLSPLHVAVANGHADAVLWLVQHGADVNQLTVSSSRFEEVPPIFLAESPEVVNVLVAHRANHLLVCQRSTALLRALISGRFMLVRVFEEWGGDVPLTPLHAAAATNNVKRIIQIMRSGANADCLGDKCNGLYYRSPLHWAAIAGCADAAATLIRFGATLDAMDYKGRTPLHWAVRNDQVEVVKVLLYAGANIHTKDHDQMCPILCGAQGLQVSEEVLAALVSAGVDVNVRLPNGDTPMHIAVKLGNTCTGADLTRINREGKRPLECTTSAELLFMIKRAAGARDAMISYTHSHSEFTMKVRDRLESLGITTWMDTAVDGNGIGGGAVWREEIARGLMNASLMICILSEDYQRSEWCLKELALAKQLQKPVIAISCEDFTVSDELQVLLYTRQIVAFQTALTKRTVVDPRQVVFEYDETAFDDKVRILADGVKDELNRIRIERNQAVSGVGPKSELLSSNLRFDQTMIEGTNFLFIAHGDTQTRFVRGLYLSLRDKGYRCFVDSEALYKDTTERISVTKDAILQCAAFICVISDKSAGSEILNDQLAFAEDRGKLIIPVFLSTPQIDLGKKYTLSRSKIFHFAEGYGYEDSLETLLDYLTRISAIETPDSTSSQQDVLKGLMDSNPRFSELLDTMLENNPDFALTGDSAAAGPNTSNPASFYFLSGKVKKDKPRGSSRGHLAL